MGRGETPLTMSTNNGQLGPGTVEKETYSRYILEILAMVSSLFLFLSSTLKRTM